MRRCGAVSKRKPVEKGIAVIRAVLRDASKTFEKIRIEVAREGIRKAPPTIRRVSRKGARRPKDAGRDPHSKLPSFLLISSSTGDSTIP